MFEPIHAKAAADLPSAERTQVQNVLEIKGLSKNFNTFSLKHLSFNVPKGYIMGFIGPNGAGKSTSIKALLGLIQPERGQVLVGPEQLSIAGVAAKQMIGYIPEFPVLYSDLTVREHARFLGMAYGIPEPELLAYYGELVERFHLLPIPPKQVILSTLAPPALTIGLMLVLVSLILATPFLAGRELLLLAALALAEGILGTVLVAREMLKDPSSSTSALGPERWISAFFLLAASAVVQLSGFWGLSVFDGLTSGLVVAGGLTVVFFILMVNKFVLLRSRYGV